MTDKDQPELRNGTGDMKITANKFSSDIELRVDWEIRGGTVNDLVLVDDELQALVGLGLESQLVQRLLAEPESGESDE